MQAGRSEMGAKALPEEAVLLVKVLHIEGLGGTAARPATMEVREVDGSPPENPPLVWGYVVDGVLPADVLRIRARLRPLDTSDYWEGLLAASGVGARVSVRETEVVRHGGSLSRWLYRFRSWLGRRFEGKAGGGFFKGLMLGDSRSIDREQYTRAREGGTVHVLVVSGLHVGIAGGLAMWLGRLMGLQITARNLLAIGLTFFYALLAGFGTSAFRAWVMFSILVASPILRREYDTINSLAAAVLLIVLLRPEDVISRGFALSLAAIGGILVAVELLAGLDWQGSSGWSRRLYAALGVSFGAWAGVAPVSAWYFGIVNVFGPVLSLLSVPVLGLFIMAGWVTIAGEVLGALAPGGFVLRWLIGSEGPVYWLVAGLGWILDAVLDAGGMVRIGLLSTWGPPFLWLVVFYVLVTVLVVYLREYRHLQRRLPEPVRRRFWKGSAVRLFFAPAAGILMLIWPVGVEAFAGPEEGLYFFSGNGEALAVVEKEGVLVLSAGMPAGDTALRRVLRSPYEFVRLRRGLSLSHGEYDIEASPGGGVVWVRKGSRLIAWSVRYKKGVAEALSRNPVMVVHTGRLYSGPEEETRGERRIIYVCRGGGMRYIAEE